MAGDEALAEGYAAEEARAAEAEWAAKMAASTAWDPTGGAVPPYYPANPGWYAAQAPPPAAQAGPQGPILPQAAAPAPFSVQHPGMTQAAQLTAQMPAQSFAGPSAGPQGQSFPAGGVPSGPFGPMLPAGASAMGQPGQNGPLPPLQGRVTQAAQPTMQAYANPAPGGWWAPGQPFPGGYRGALLQGLPTHVSGVEMQENALRNACENSSLQNSNLIQNLFANSSDQQGLTHQVGGDNTHQVGGDITHQTGGDLTHQVGGDTTRGPSTSTHHSGGDIHTKVQNVGPKPPKWNGDTPFLAFRMELVLHFKAIGLPKQQWGQVGLTFLDVAPRNTLLAKIATDRNVETTPEQMAEMDISWDDFSKGMDQLFGQQCSEEEIRQAIEQHTAPHTSGPDTLSYIQILDQLYALCRKSVDPTSKIGQLRRGLRHDLFRETLLDKQGLPWSDYNALRAYLYQIGPTYDKEWASCKSVGNTGYKNPRQTGNTKRVPDLPVRRTAFLQFKKDGRPDVSKNVQGQGRPPQWGRAQHPAPQGGPPPRQPPAGYPDAATGRLPLEVDSALRRAQLCTRCYAPRPPGQAHQCTPQSIGRPAPSWTVSHDLQTSNSFAVLSDESADLENVDSDKHTDLPDTHSLAYSDVDQNTRASTSLSCAVMSSTNMCSAEVPNVTATEDINVLCAQFKAWDAAHPLARKPIQPRKQESVHTQITYHGIPVPKVIPSRKEISLQDVENRQLKVSEFKKL